MVLKSGINRPVSHISSTLRWTSRSRRRHRLDAVEIAVNVALQQDRRVISRPACVGWDSTVKEIRSSVIDKDMDYAHRVGDADVVAEALRK